VDSSGSEYSPVAGFCEQIMNLRLPQTTKNSSSITREYITVCDFFLPFLPYKEVVPVLS
jgi:hypothetical protein